MNETESTWPTLPAKAEFGFIEHQMFNELTRRMQAIARGEEKNEILNDFMNSRIDSRLDYEI